MRKNPRRIIALILVIISLTTIAATAFAALACDCGGKLHFKYGEWKQIATYHGAPHVHYQRTVTVKCDKCSFRTSYTEYK